MELRPYFKDSAIRSCSVKTEHSSRIWKLCIVYAQILSSKNGAILVKRTHNDLLSFKYSNSNTVRNLHGLKVISFTLSIELVHVYRRSSVFNSCKIHSVA